MSSAAFARRSAAPPGRQSHEAARPAALRISQPGDAAEREAESAAERVLRGEQVQIGAVGAPLARKCAACDELDGERRAEIQRKETGEAPPFSQGPPAVAAALASGGQPLDAAARAYFEPRFGTSFAGVRIHADASAASAARGIAARAFTVGRQIGFAAGQYAPETGPGRRLLAHELAHVAQNARGAPAEVRRTANVEDCQGEDDGQVARALRVAPLAARITGNAILVRPLPSATQASLTRIFGPNAVQRSAAIALRLYRIAAGLPRITVECEYPGTVFYNRFCSAGTMAYVRAVPAWFGFGNIHLCQPRFRELTPIQQLATIVHEGAHRLLDSNDEAYFNLDCTDNAETLALSESDRMDNADCYGCLVQSVLSGTS